MEKISQIISKIENNKNCIVSKLSTPYKNIPLDIPKDLKFYLENYESITFFQNSDYSIKTIGFTEFKRANEIILGENFEEDIKRGGGKNYLMSKLDEPELVLDCTGLNEGVYILKVFFQNFKGQEIVKEIRIKIRK